jgi:DNA-binding Lrp family transcriptional regulator
VNRCAICCTTQATCARQTAQLVALSAYDLYDLFSCETTAGARVPPESTLDALDVDLLRTLRDHPRAGVLQLSRELGVARGTAQARLDRLERRGVITGYGPDVDLRAAGFPVQAFVTLEIAQGALAEAAAELNGVPAVLEAYTTTGDADVLCRVAAASHEDLQEVLLALNRLPTIGRSTSVVTLSVVVAPRVLPVLEREPRPVPSRAPAYRRSTPPDAGASGGS